MGFLDAKPKPPSIDGFNNVDNTRDKDKPVSGPQQLAIDTKLGVLEGQFDADNIYARAGARLTIPTHVSPAGGQTTHPSVLYFPQGWNGYKYWMAHTPYPAGNDDYEDPNICASQDGITWVVPTGLTNPIDDATGNPEYNSDVDLKMGPNNTMYLFWRWYANQANGGTEERLKYATSTDGVTWSVPTIFYQSDHTVLRLASPSLIFEDGAWTMVAVDILPSPNRVVRLRSASASPTSTWSAPATINVGTMQAGKEPWHIFILKFAGRYYGLLNDCTTDQNGSNGDILFIQSLDGVTWTNSGVPALQKTLTGEHDQVYRSTMVPAFREGRLGFRVWYTGWLTAGPVWNVYRTFMEVGAWKPLTLAGAWVPYTGSGGYKGGLRYKKVGHEVTVEGTVKSGAAGSVIATLPAGFAPLATTFHATNSGGSVVLIQFFADAAAGSAPADERTIKYFSGAAAPGYLTINFRYEVA